MEDRDQKQTKNKPKQNKKENIKTMQENNFKKN